MVSQLKNLSSKVLAVIVLMAVAPLTVNASVIDSWDLINKRPGALGLDYGLRLNKLSSTLGFGTMIFDFEHASSSMKMTLVKTGSDYEIRVTGTTFGAEYVANPKAFGTTYDGLYAVDFIWKDVELDTAGWDFVAELGLGTFAKGVGAGSVTGLTAGTAFTGGLDIFSYSGKFDHTLDVKYGRNPELEGWLTYEDGHAGDFGFSLVSHVPEPATLGLLGLGLLGLGLRKCKQA